MGAVPSRSFGSLSAAISFVQLFRIIHKHIALYVGLALNYQLCKNAGECTEARGKAMPPLFHTSTPWIAIVLGGMVCIGAARADQTCEFVYQNATRDIDVQTKVYQQLDYTYDNYCNRDGTKKTFTMDDSVSAVFDDLPFTFKSNKGATDERVTEFCRQYSSERYIYNRYYSYKNDVQVGALNAYNECVALKTKGVLIGYEPDGVVGGSISGTFKDRTTALVIHAVLYDKKLVACKISSDDFTTATSIDDTKPVKVDKNFTIACRRTPSKESGRDYYPSTDIRLDTNSGGYTVHFEGDALNGYYLASEAKAQYDAAQSQLTQAKQSEDILLDRIKKASVTSYRFYNGDPGGDSALTGPRRNCEANLTPYAQAVCGKRKPFFAAIAPGAGGGRCGYAYYNLACLDLDDSPPPIASAVPTTAPASPTAELILHISSLTTVSKKSDEAEVTPTMLAAGLKEYNSHEHQDELSEQTLARIFRAMEDAGAPIQP